MDQEQESNWIITLNDGIALDVVSEKEQRQPKEQVHEQIERLKGGELVLQEESQKVMQFERSRYCFACCLS